MFGAIDHVGIAVENLDEAIDLYSDSFGMSVDHRETVIEMGVEAVLLSVGEAHIELLSPLGEDTPVGKFLAKKGRGLHHVAYRCDDVAASLERCRQGGLRLIDEQPRIGIRKSRVAFLHPASTGGVLTELVQPAESH